MTLELHDAPAGDYMFGAHVDVSVDGIEFPLDFTLHHVDSGITYFSPYTVKRKPIYR